MNGYEDAYESAMEPTNSFNWEPPAFDRAAVRRVFDNYLIGLAQKREIYCWHCNRELAAEFSYYCFDCREECWAYWGC
jgi:hypothetical protein